MLTTIINYCTNDYRFLEMSIREAKKFSKEIIVPVCDHFFDGMPENRKLLEHSYAEHPDVQFVEFAFDKEPYGLYARIREDDPDWSHYWHSTARYVGYQFALSEHVLFIDVDEVADGDRMLAWLTHFPYRDWDGIRLTSYFYFREARFQAKKIMMNGLLVKKATLPAELLLDIHERKGTFHSLSGERLEGVSGLEGVPLFHHYSWVKTKEEMHRKVSSWGHRFDKDWHTLIEQEFAHPFALRDRFWGFEYQEVEPLADPLLVKMPEEFRSNPFPNVTKVNRNTLQTRIIQGLV